MSKLAVLFGDNMGILPELPSSSVDLIYIDPPFNTGKQQERTCLKTFASVSGDRVGFNGRRYQTVKMGTLGYADIFTDYIQYIEPRLVEAYRLLTDRGSLFFHIDYRESHYCKILLDMVFGRKNFMNEIIWSYDYGARSKKRWSCKHDSILWYTKNHLSYIFNYDAIDRIPYMTPELVGKEKAAKGKTPTDVWWNTIVSPIGREKTGYATQKPRRILERIISVHSNPNSLVGDFFAGSGSFGAAAYALGRDCFLIDKNKEAIEVMKKRFAGINVDWHVNTVKSKSAFSLIRNRENYINGNTSSRYGLHKYPPSIFDEATADTVKQKKAKKGSSIAGISKKNAKKSSKQSGKESEEFINFTNSLPTLMEMIAKPKKGHLRVNIVKEK